MEFCFNFFVNSNHSHNSNMVKDKHAKALDFMVNIKYTDKCIGYDAGEKNCYCLKQFLGEEISQRDAKIFFGNISYDIWNGIGEDDDEDMIKEKIIYFLNPFHVIINKKEICFHFQVPNYQSSVTERMEI